MDSLRPRFGCIVGAEVLQAAALLLSAGFSCHDAASPSRFLMTLALMAEYQDTIVAVALLAPAGALYSTGNVTSRASSSHGGALLHRPLFALPGALVLASCLCLLRVRELCGCGGGVVWVVNFVFEDVAATRRENSMSVGRRGSSEF